MRIIISPVRLFLFKGDKDKEKHHCCSIQCVIVNYALLLDKAPTLQLSEKQ